MERFSDWRAEGSGFVLDNFAPVYLRPGRRGELPAKLEAARRELLDCRACPRDCGINRLEGEIGFCETGRFAVVSSAFPHFGEEQVLRGRYGSGTIFFCQCNLRCVFCQNWEISQRRTGTECSGEEIAARMLALQDRGCHNINLVTPEHVVPQVVEAIVAAVAGGLRIPIVYNTSAYDSVESLRLLDGLVDVYMPDFKFWRRESARTLVKAKDYPERAREAILEMHRQVGSLRIGRDGLARRGVLVRHLVMPGGEEETAAIVEWLAREVSLDTYVNLMGQYHPAYQVGTAAGARRRRYEEIARPVSRQEMRAAHESARRAGLWRVESA
jgi:putative pyruvate formate lyase activating enzyme